MLNRITKGRDSVLDEPIATLLTRINAADPLSPEYDKLSAKLEKLHTLKATTARPRVSPDTIAKGLFELGMVGFVVLFETRHAWLTKALDIAKKSNR